MSEVVTLIAAATSTVALAAVCTSGALVVGDDSRGAPDAAPSDDAARPTSDAAPPDAAPDAPPGACVAAAGTCLGAGSACEGADTTGLVCPAAGDLCCLVTCPSAAGPAPGFCDGGPFAERFDAHGCVVGYACAPVGCASAGGQCVAVAPGACSSNRIGDVNRYSCGGGLGVMCCLP